jgi:pimeloyl-ACP methyl ester carboxylesterase
MESGTYTSSDGLNLFYRDYGCDAPKGVPVVCLPGLTRNSRDFAVLARHLTKARRILCPDFRGRGFSDRDPKYTNYHPTNYVQDVIALAAHLNLDKVVIVGTSLGGLVAMGLAAAKPALLAGVVLNDIGPEIDPKGAARLATYVGLSGPITTWQEASAEVKRLNGAPQPHRADEFWAEYAHAVFRENEQGVPEFDYDPMIGDAMREAPAAPPELMWALFGALKPIPTLALRGEDSDILSADTFERMAVEKPDLAQALVKGVGHAPFLDEPDGLQAIEEFLSKVD